MSGSSKLDSFRDGWEVAVQLLFCEVLAPGLLRYCLQHSCVVAVKLFLHKKPGKKTPNKQTKSLPYKMMSY